MSYIIGKIRPYFRYLKRLTGDRDEYSLLLEHLHSTDFFSLVDNDNNRGEDGKHLREIFLEDTGNKALSRCMDEECTVLEMLIGLSLRMEFQISGDAVECFWLLIRNLGLDRYTDEEWNSRGGIEEVNECIYIWLNREYLQDGKGGLFPLKRPKHDQTKLEIWYQMHEYLMENFEF